MKSYKTIEEQFLEIRKMINHAVDQYLSLMEKNAELEKKCHLYWKLSCTLSKENQRLNEELERSRVK